MIPENCKKIMLEAVRRHLEYYLQLSQFDAELPNDPIFNEDLGLFVTLHKKGDLRGCIGYIEGIKPLGEALFDMAESAAFHDPRFPAVKPHEMEEIDIEISVLSPLEKLKSWHDIRIGYHGILLRYSGRQAVFLPQVAPEQGWDLETTLSYLSQKAGCRPNDFKKQEAEFLVFSAEVFSENT